MLKRIFILIIFVLGVSAASLADPAIIKEKANVNEMAAVKSDTTGIKDELADESLKQILADVIKIKKGKIGEIVSKFLKNTSHWVWIIVEGGLPENVNGQTTLTSDGALTILDYDKLQTATNLAVARILIHEMVHAYLTLYFKYDAINAIMDYPAILNAWATAKDPDLNKIQHDEMERSFIDEIALALDEYSETVGLNKVDKSVYTDLAWGGLDFQNNIKLTGNIKQRIQNRLLAEQLNGSFGGEKPVAFSVPN